MRDAQPKATPIKLTSRVAFVPTCMADHAHTGMVCLERMVPKNSCNKTIKTGKLLNA